MRRIGRAEQAEGEVPAIDELVARVEAVTADDVARVVDRVLRDAPPTLAVVGPHDASEFARSRSALNPPAVPFAR